jgi:hypothetical protein
LIWENINAIIESAYNNLPKDEAQKVWKCLTIGTDFEGLIDPPNPYSSVLEFGVFAGNLIFEIEQARKNGNPKHLAHFKNLDEVRAAVEDFCFNNAADFVKKHYPKG